MNRKSGASKVALCGVATALCIAVMFASGIIPVLTYTLPAFCGLVIMFVSMAVGRGAGWLVFVATAFLAVFLTPDKECAVMFVAFFGYYPVLKFTLEKVKNRFGRTVLKFLVFNVAIVLSQFIVIEVLGLPIESDNFLGKWLVPVLLVLANILFVAYDFALVQVVRVYQIKWKKIFNKFLK